jgi:hypothetical protein
MSKQAMDKLINKASQVVTEAGLGHVSTSVPSTMMTNLSNARSFVYNGHSPQYQLNASLAINPNVFASMGNVLA